MVSLRNLYEEKQRSHQHTLSGDKQVTFAYLSADTYRTVPALSPTSHRYRYLIHFTYIDTRVLSSSHCCLRFLQVYEEAAPAPVEAQQQSSSRQRLEQFKSRAKRSLTESLEGIWKVAVLLISWFECTCAYEVMFLLLVVYDIKQNNRKYIFFREGSQLLILTF